MFSQTPTLLLACDLGKSGGKFFYKRLNGQAHALWMESEVAQRSAAGVAQLSQGGRPQDNAWLRLGDDLVFVGKAAQAFLDYNSFKEDKSLKAAERIAGALGAIAKTDGLPNRFEAIVWVLLPINELATRQRIASRLLELCQGFSFQDEIEYRIDLKLSFRPEGYGIYVQRKCQLKQAGVSIAQRTTWIEMLGHRNGSQLAFETGTLNAAKSTSKFPGFWEPFEKAASAAGVSVTEYDVLLKALETGQSQQYSVAKGETIDFSDAMAQVEASYLDALDSHFNDHLIPSLATGKGDVILAGGAAYLMRQALQSYFEDRGFSSRLSLAWEDQDALTRQVEAQLPESYEMPSMAMRMTDSFGLFQALLGEMNRMKVAS